MVLGLIPAKGGSTRLAQKNIRPLGGKPLLAWTAEAAKTCQIFDRLIVSTEDEKVAQVAGSLGLEIPFLRPAHLALDPAGVVDVALHALEELERRGDRYETLIILLPTCPFRNAQDICAAYTEFRDHGASCLMSVAPFSHTPFSALSLNDQKQLKPYFPELLGRKSQEMPGAYRPNGAIHILDVEWFKENKSYFGPPLLGYLMPRGRSVDIDTEDDLRMAEVLLAMNR